jgi:hypothetical protein
MWRLFKLWAWLVMEIDWWLKTYVGVYDDKVSYFSFYIPVHVLTGLECNRFEDFGIKNIYWYY